MLALTECEVETASIASHVSDDSDDFVVIIPDCFDLNKPLPGYDRDLTPPATQDQQAEGEESVIEEPPTPQATTELLPSTQLPSEPHGMTPPAVTTSPPTARKGSFGRVTLQTVKDGGFRNPLTIATGFMNTMSDLVEEHVRFVPSVICSPITHTEGTQSQERNESDNEEMFEVNKKHVAYLGYSSTGCPAFGRVGTTWDS